MQQLAEHMKDKKHAGRGRFFLDWSAVIAVLCSILFFTVYTQAAFLSAANLTNILRSMSITTILAVALTVTLACDGFDMSACTLASCSGYVFMACYLWYGMSLAAAVAVCLLFTMAAYTVTLFLILVCKIPDMLATCALMFIHQGLGQWFTGGGAISAGMGQPDGTLPQRTSFEPAFTAIGQAPWIILIMFGCVAAAHIFLNHTKQGTFLYAIGSNKTAAALSGIQVGKYRCLAGMLTAIFIAIGAMTVCSRNAAAQLCGCDNYLMPSLAAVFVGRSVGGKEKPTALGTVLGAGLIVVLENGLTLCSVPYYVLPAVKGGVLAVALAAAYLPKKGDYIS